ncbi:MAG: DUF2807 domain-containing protein [Chitinophagaceae bacterium]|nr:DUF2807 domain-containing protein [Chitinophagaceae bacterium]
MKILFAAFFSVIILISCNGINGGIHGSGNIKTEQRNVGDFNGVLVSSSIDVEVVQGDHASVEISADDNVLRYIIVDINNGMLDIRQKDNTSFNDTHISAKVTAPVINKLYVEGSGNLTVNNILKDASQIEIKLQGSGDIDATVNAPLIKITSDGSGNITLKGKTQTLDAQSSGSGDLKCADLLSENTMITSNGSGNSNVYSSVSIKAKTNGSGDINYSGKPKSTQIEKNGSGSIEAGN